MTPSSTRREPKSSPKQTASVDVLFTDSEYRHIERIAQECGTTVEQAAAQLARESLSRRVRPRYPQGGIR